VQNRYDPSVYGDIGDVGDVAVQARGGLLGKVAALLTFSMLFTVVGAAVGMQVPGLIIPAWIAVMILSFAIGFARAVPGLQIVLLYTMTSLVGVLVGAVAERYVSAGAGGVVVQAGATTALMTFGLAGYALVTRRDFSGWIGKLTLAFIALFVASLVGIFVGGGLFQILIGYAGAVLFSFFIIYYVQRAKTGENTLSNAILITSGLYLSIINLFFSLLRIFGGGGGGRR